jgi:hypothetical protein
MIQVVVVLLLFAAALVLGFRRWGIPGALAAMGLAELLAIVWNVWETVAWQHYGDGPPSEIARAIGRNWSCHTLDGLPAILLLAGPATLLLWGCRKRMTRWPVQLLAVLVTFAVMAVPVVLASVIWSMQVLSCDAS